MHDKSDVIGLLDLLTTFISLVCLSQVITVITIAAVQRYFAPTPPTRRTRRRRNRQRPATLTRRRSPSRFPSRSTSRASRDRTTRFPGRNSRPGVRTQGQQNRSFGRGSPVVSSACGGCGTFARGTSPVPFSAWASQRMLRSQAVRPTPSPPPQAPPPPYSAVQRSFSPDTDFVFLATTNTEIHTVVTSSDDEC